MADNEQDIKELIIIRRRASAEADQVKGGVWKIAFADFMTAMMCFFLVMWLINAANEDTRQAVASYFNPMRLAELNRKGVEDPYVAGINTPQRGDPAEEEEEAGGNTGGEAAAELTRDALFRDPYGVLSDIVSKAEEDQADSSEAVPSAPSIAPTLNVRDPFDPEFRDVGRAVGAAPEDTTQAEVAQTGTASFETAQTEDISVAALETGESGPEAGQETSQIDVSTLQTTGRATSKVGDVEMPNLDGSLPMSSLQGVPPPADVGLPETQPSASETSPAPERLTDIEEQIVEAAVDESGRSPNVTVERTGGGVLISLTDDARFGMFAIGSAEPQPQMVRIMERIAEILRARGGPVTIRGHTDGRPFRSGSYDNWRLSTDRAQMAYYMLVRGGLEERRVAAIEGYADRKLKVPEDAEAAENRRIEIFLREEAP